jgi:hypothetical protein
MADNLSIKDGAGADKTIRTTDNAGVHTPHHIVAANPSTTAATLTQGVNTVAAAGTPEALVGSATLVEKVIITATKGFNSANTGAVFVGQSSTNDQNYIRLMPWDVLILDAPPGKKIDLNQIYIDVVTNGDGVAYFAIN